MLRSIQLNCWKWYRWSERENYWRVRLETIAGIHWFCPTSMTVRSGCRRLQSNLSEKLRTITMRILFSNLYSEFRWVNVTHRASSSGCKRSLFGNSKIESHKLRLAKPCELQVVTAVGGLRLTIESQATLQRLVYGNSEWAENRKLRLLKQSQVGERTAFEHLANYAKIDTFQSVARVLANSAHFRFLGRILGHNL